MKEDIVSKVENKVVAYFSMEIALDDQIPNYAGGLGVLAADILYSAADMKIPMIGVSLIYHQSENKNLAFDPTKFMEKLPQQILLPIENRKMVVNIYRFEIVGQSGFKIPIYFLSSNNKVNVRWDRDLTKNLYASDPYTRLGQEYILGAGGVKVLEELGEKVDIYHMNEGHSALLTLELLKQEKDQNQVKSKCTFTTHTPVAAGHDYFDYPLVTKTIGDIIPANIRSLSIFERLGMTQLAMNLSKCSNSVSLRHNDVCRKMFPGRDFKNVTNGIYHKRWIGSEMAKLFDKFLNGWETDPGMFKKVHDLPHQELLKAKLAEKKLLIKWINSHSEYFPFADVEDHDLFDENILTLGFARRFVPYKRPELIFHNLEQLRKLGYEKLQLIFAGHCNPGDWFCEQVKQTLTDYAHQLRGQIKLVILPDYNLVTALKLVAGCDVWLNNPIQPMEASGTSGMKAALNGGLNLSILDGWWIEGYNMNPLSGWRFGSNFVENNNSSDIDAAELYKNLEELIDCYYHNNDQWIARMKAAISLIDFFNTNRVVEQYQQNIWGL